MSTTPLLTLIATTLLIASFGVVANSHDDLFGTDDGDDRARQHAEPAPSLVVDAQVSDGETVTISRANLNTTGWVVIHADVGGTFGEVLGNSERLEEGLHVGIDVDVNITAEQNQTITLHAMLHRDTGNESYTFPAGDPPLLNQSGEVVVHPFTVFIGEQQAVVANGPVIVRSGADAGATGGDQGGSDMAGEVTLTVAVAKLNQSGYVVIHKDAGGSPGEVIGQTEFLEAGAHQDVEVTVRNMAVIFGDGQTGGNQTGDGQTGGNQTGGNQTGGNQTGDNQTGDNQTGHGQTGPAVTLWAMIHIDDGNEEYEFPGPDAPLAVDGEVVMTQFPAVPGDEGRSDDGDVGEDVPGDGDDGEDGEDGDTPGFTLVVALASVLFAASFLRNRRRA